MRSKKISATTLVTWLTDGAELALLDAREQGVYFDSHLFHAACVPLSKVELLLARLVPRRDTRLVWCDDGATDLAERAAGRATEMGWTNVALLGGGTRAWEASGGELYSGVNVASKAFGELIEQKHNTPHIEASKLMRMLDRGDDVVVLDSRPNREFRRMSIPTATDCPGAELVHRVKEMAPNPDTIVVVNCAGRTRSIIGAQSLINAGLENPVLALENGTMGWELAGLELDHGRDIHAPDPGPATRAWAKDAARAVGQRFGVEVIDQHQLAEWLAEDDRTTYVLDVRTSAEFEASHLPGSSHAPGGQLVQATDEYVATRNARVVLVDDNGVRSTMTASWLRQLGWADTVVLAGGIDGGNDIALASGPVPRLSAGRVPTMKVSELAKRLADPEDNTTVLDIGTSLKYRKRGHIPGAYWGIRSRLDEAKEVIGEVPAVVLTSTDGLLAKFAVTDAQTAWPDAEVTSLAGGNRAWRHAKHEMVAELTAPTTDANDVWYKPYDHGDDVAEQHMRDYLSWEIALVGQIDRDPTVSFPAFG